MLEFQGKAPRLFYSLFFFFFFFFLFFFWKTHWPSFHGVLNLLKVVNEAKADFAMKGRGGRGGGGGGGGGEWYAASQPNEEN